MVQQAEMKIPNFKIQTPINLQPQTGLHWRLDVGWVLEFGFWSFSR
jgi:hypothetical protein